MQTHNIPLHHKAHLPRTKKQATAFAEHVMVMNQFNSDGFRKPKTSLKRMMQAPGIYMTLAERSSVAAGIMEPFKPDAEANRAERRLASGKNAAGPINFPFFYDEESTTVRERQATRARIRKEALEASRAARKENWRSVH